MVIPKPNVILNKYQAPLVLKPIKRMHFTEVLVSNFSYLNFVIVAVFLILHIKKFKANLYLCPWCDSDEVVTLDVVRVCPAKPVARRAEVPVCGCQVTATPCVSLWCEIKTKGSNHYKDDS